MQRLIIARQLFHVRDVEPRAAWPWRRAGSSVRSRSAASSFWRQPQERAAPATRAVPRTTFSVPQSQRHLSRRFFLASDGVGCDEGACREAGSTEVFGWRTRMMMHGQRERCFTALDDFGTAVACATVEMRSRPVAGPPSAGYNQATKRLQTMGIRGGAIRRPFPTAMIASDSDPLP